MKRTTRSEKRKGPRHGLALRVVLRDHRPPIHAITRDFSLGGMHLMTATRKLQPDKTLTAEVEIDRNDQRWTPPLPLHVVWTDDTHAGVAFNSLPAKTVVMLGKLIAETRARHKRPTRRHERGS